MMVLGCLLFLVALVVISYVATNLFIENKDRKYESELLRDESDWNRRSPVDEA